MDTDSESFDEAKAIKIIEKNFIDMRPDLLKNLQNQVKAMEDVTMKTVLQSILDDHSNGKTSFDDCVDNYRKMKTFFENYQEQKKR